MGSDTFTHHVNDKTDYIDKFVLIKEKNICINYAGIAGIRYTNLYIPKISDYLIELYKNEMTNYSRPQDIATKLREVFIPIHQSFIKSTPRAIIKNPRYNCYFKFDVGGFDSNSKPELFSIEIDMNGQKTERNKYAIVCPDIVKKLYKDTYGNAILTPEQETLQAYISHVRTVIKTGVDYDMKMNTSWATSGGEINIIVVTKNSLNLQRFKRS